MSYHVQRGRFLIVGFIRTILQDVKDTLERALGNPDVYEIIPNKVISVFMQQEFHGRICNFLTR